MESWRKVWRDGFVPLLTVEHLTEIRRFLMTDDPHLIQGAITAPPSCLSFQYWPVESACLLGVCGLVDHGGWGKATVGEVEDTFVRLCFEVGQLLNEPAVCRHFLNWFDETPRDEMRRAMIQEVDLALESKVNR